MRSSSRRRLLGLALAVTCALAIVSSRSDARARGQAQPAEVKIFLVALDDKGKAGKKVGCDDSLVAVSRTLEAGVGPLEGAIRALLAAPEETPGTPALGNYWKGTDLKLASVVLRGGTATIRITGEISVAGVCDEPRITGQIEETARQFPTVKRVRVYVNGRALAQVIR